MKTITVGPSSGVLSSPSNTCWVYVKLLLFLCWMHTSLFGPCFHDKVWSPGISGLVVTACTLVCNLIQCLHWARYLTSKVPGNTAVFLPTSWEPDPVLLLGQLGNCIVRHSPADESIPIGEKLHRHCRAFPQAHQLPLCLYYFSVLEMPFSQPGLWEG